MQELCCGTIQLSDIHSSHTIPAKSIFFFFFFFYLLGGKKATEANETLQAWESNEPLSFRSTKQSTCKMQNTDEMQLQNL